MSDPIAFEEHAGEGGLARRTLLRRLIDFIAMPASQVAPQDRSMGGDILLDMLFHATDSDRLLCAKRIAVLSDAPRRLLRYLAQCNIDIARPLLEDSESFDSSDLLEIIDQVTPDHRVLIAKRKRVPAVVSDQLARRGEISAVKALIQNKGAELSETAIDILVERSRKEGDLSSLLITRLELKPAQAMAMFWWSDRDTRRTILQRHAADRGEMVNMCADVFAIAAKEGWSDPVARKTLQLIERRQRNRQAIERSEFESLEAAIETAATMGMSPEMVEEIGYLAGIKPVTSAKILSDTGGEGIAVLCKATGLKRPSLKNLWISLKRPLEADDGTPHMLYEHLQETYDLLSVAKAQTTLRYWNWSLSSSYSPNQAQPPSLDDAHANDESAFSTSRRTASLVFGS
ncbi:MAG: DUF2336 domain-containing protein [Hyphomonadaceae bacterium]|nr:DUF2336 domain-containing protein [Hyphomonadaceae bacterium]